MMRGVATVAALGLATACSPAVEEEVDMAETGAEEHYYPSSAETADGPNPWIVILPGGGGIEVFGDAEFYFDVARHFLEHGFVDDRQSEMPFQRGLQEPQESRFPNCLD